MEEQERSWAKGKDEPEWWESSWPDDNPCRFIRSKIGIADDAFDQRREITGISRNRLGVLQYRQAWAAAPSLAFEMASAGRHARPSTGSVRSSALRSPARPRKSSRYVATDPSTRRTTSAPPRRRTGHPAGRPPTPPRLPGMSESLNRTPQTSGRPLCGAYLLDYARSGPSVIPTHTTTQRRTVWLAHEQPGEQPCRPLSRPFAVPAGSRAESLPVPSYPFGASGRAGCDPVARAADGPGSPGCRKTAEEIRASMSEMSAMLLPTDHRCEGT
ncbi:hypothetical protein BH24ACT15_BH24ACT15_32740 [soil metagenome]